MMEFGLSDSLFDELLVAFANTIACDSSDGSCYNRSADTTGNHSACNGPSSCQAKDKLALLRFGPVDSRLLQLLSSFCGIPLCILLHFANFTKFLLLRLECLDLLARQLVETSIDTLYLFDLFLAVELQLALQRMAVDIPQLLA